MFFMIYDVERFVLWPCWPLRNKAQKIEGHSVSFAGFSCVDGWDGRVVEQGVYPFALLVR